MATQMAQLTAEQVRREYPLLETTTFLDCAYKGPYPVRSVRAMHEFIEARHLGVLPDGRGDGRPERIEATRGKVARLLGVTPDEIWFPQSTNHGLLAVANLLLRPGDEILVGGLDHPSNYATWSHLANRGVKVTVVPHRSGRMEVGDVEAAIGPSTRAIGMCMVATYNGYRVDVDALAEMAGRRGLYLLLDGIQGMGHLDIDLSSGNVTCLAAGVFKWFCTPEGTGICYVNRKVLTEARPDMIYYFGIEPTSEDGWTSVIDQVFKWGHEGAGPQTLSPETIRYLPNARVLEGSATMLSLTALDSMVSMLLEFGGMSAVQHRVLGLSAHLKASLQERGHTVISDTDPASQSGITSVQVPNSAEFAAFCEERNIWVLAQKAQMVTALGAEAVRVSTHFFNNEDDIAAFVGAMDAYRDRRP